MGSVLGVAGKLRVVFVGVGSIPTDCVRWPDSSSGRLEGLGPAGGNSRSPNEYILRDSLIDRATLLALIIRECIK